MAAHWLGLWRDALDAGPADRNARPEFYNRDAPAIGGMLFFYWYQFVGIPVSVACTWIVYRVTRRPR